VTGKFDNDGDNDGYVWKLGRDADVYIWRVAGLGLRKIHPMLHDLWQLTTIACFWVLCHERKQGLQLGVQ
jgi:hypothetical protein